MGGTLLVLRVDLARDRTSNGVVSDEVLEDRPHHDSERLWIRRSRHRGVFPRLIAVGTVVRDAMRTTQGDDGFLGRTEGADDALQRDSLDRSGRRLQGLAPGLKTFTGRRQATRAGGQRYQPDARKRNQTPKDGTRARRDEHRRYKGHDRSMAATHQVSCLVLNTGTLRARVAPNSRAPRRNDFLPPLTSSTMPRGQSAPDDPCCRGRPRPSRDVSHRPVLGWVRRA